MNYLIVVFRVIFFVPVVIGRVLEWLFGENCSRMREAWDVTVGRDQWTRIPSLVFLYGGLWVATVWVWHRFAIHHTQDGIGFLWCVLLLGWTTMIAGFSLQVIFGESRKKGVCDVRF